MNISTCSHAPHTHAHTTAHTHAHAHAHAHARAHTRVCMHAHTHPHTHTHFCVFGSSQGSTTVISDGCKRRLVSWCSDIQKSHHQNAHLIYVRAYACPRGLWHVHTHERPNIRFGYTERYTLSQLKASVSLVPTKAAPFNSVVCKTLCFSVYHHLYSQPCPE